MKRERLTREQRKEQTRERLLEAARMLFVEKGLAAASVEGIAETAGYSRGAFYSNFDGKPQLLIELLRRDLDSAQANLRAVVEKGGAREQMKALAIGYYTRRFQDRHCSRLWAEATLLACRDSGFQERFNAFQHERLDLVSAYIRTFSKHDGGSLPMRADALALCLLSLCDGARFCTLCDPQVASDQMMGTVLAEFFSWVLGRQSEEK